MIVCVYSSLCEEGQQRSSPSELNALVKAYMECAQLVVTRNMDASLAKSLIISQVSHLKNLMLISPGEWRNLMLISRGEWRNLMLISLVNGGILCLFHG